MNKLIITITAIFLLSQIAIGQDKDFWLEKSYTSWDKDEIKKLISDSPWAKVVGSAGRGSSEAYVTVRLRSAMPIRQARARQPSWAPIRLPPCWR